MDFRALDILAAKYRIDTIEMIYNAKAGHIGGDLSVIDVLTVLYNGVMNYNVKNPSWEERDRFILSKGHCVEALYSVLGNVGYFDKSELKELGTFGTKFIGHPTKKVPGIEMNTGSLGHGLSIGAGMALAAKKDKKDYRVFVVMGDGEQGEGSIYEAAMFSSHYKLDNLVVFIDRNKLQISGKTEDIMSLEPLAERWKAFGFEVKEIDGNNHKEIFEVTNKENKTPNKPLMIISNTIKGKGVSFMENKKEWHHGVLNKEQYEQAINELSSYILEKGGN